MAVLMALIFPVSACARPAPDGGAQGSAATRQASAANSTGRASIASGGGPGMGLTLRQFEQRREQRVMAADNDNDGKVNRAEFMAAMTGGKGNPAKRFAHLDRNSDGFINRQEIDAAATRRFGKLDADGDGRVSKQERRGGAYAVSGRTVDDDAG
ncbi:EF-hand domain-containing protein [Sphingomonas sp. PAMC 26617]|uniref:EF-hand domain-containing protein n=1 Tax=Sphingomonas sp. PAMC 26617 TaxID=1112216 RepID=UPI00031EA815|nr:hypothetical protein [Sphingomonas sp. PAMC 26617]